MTVLVEIAPLDPASGTRKPLRFADADDASVTGLNDLAWWPGVIASPTLRMDGWDGDFTGTAQAASASIQIDPVALRRLDSGSPAYRWAGAPLRVWQGKAGADWSTWKQLFVGLVDDYGTDEAGRYSFSAQVDGEPFEADILSATYAGTGDGEGNANLKDKPKPALFGRARNVEPIQIDAVNNVYQVHGYGPVQAISAVYERAADLVLNGGTNVGNFATYAGLIAATVVEGSFATCLALGMFRLGAPPAGLITADVDGDNTGGFSRTTAAVITRLCALAGVATDRVNASSLAALPTYPVNLYLTGSTKLMDMVRALSQACNAQAIVSWTGVLQVVRFGAIPPSTVTLDAQGRQRPPVLVNQEAKVSPPYWRIEMRGNRCWRPHTNDEIATSAPLIDLGPYDDATTYREGNIVQHDGSSWIYINLTASAGHTPPTLPIEEDDWWHVLARAGADGDDGTSGAAGLPGTNGQSIHIAYANSADGTVNFTAGDAGGRSYIGVYTDTNAGADSTNPAAYGWTLIRGQDGANGLPGPGGYVHLAYANSADGTADFHVSDPTGRAYLGAYTDQTLADSTNPAAYAWSRIKGDRGENGLDGAAGIPGPPGSGAASYVHIAYADSVDGSVNFTTGTAGARTYIGIYSDGTAADSNDYHAYTWSQWRGSDGTNGIPGAPGANGQTTYVHFAYANSADGSASFHTSDPTGRAYIGVYTDFTLADSNDYHAYTWSLIKGANGLDGTQGVPGPPGSGSASFIHLAYADNADGTSNFTTGAAGGRLYIGIYTDATEADSTNPALYTWSRWKGVDGTNGVPGAAGANGQTPYTHFAYSNASNGSVDFHTSDPAGRGYLGVFTDFTVADSTNPADYTWSLIKGTNGAAGANGTPGPPGANGEATYVHVAYATAADGTTSFSTTDGAGRTYIGTYTDGTLADSTNPALYTWSLIKGADGSPGAPGNPGTPGAPGSPGTAGPPGASADDLGLGILDSGTITVSLGSTGNTTITAVSKSISLLAGRKLRLTLGATNPSRSLGSNIVTAGIDVTLGSQALFSGNALITSAAALSVDPLIAAAAAAPDNATGGGTQTLTISYSRGGPSGNAGGFTMSYLLERI